MTLLAQVGPAPQGPMDMILGGTPSTQIILIVLAAFSLASWSIMVWKWGQFRKLKRQGVRFLQAIEKTPRLRDAYRTLARLPESPYTSVFRQGLAFFNELRPGALTDEAAHSDGISEAQLQALRLVLEKGQGEERDDIAAGLVWLAVIGTVSPLLGLLGTVIGVMNAFLGITATGSANIGAVAPGVAEALVTTVAGLAVAIPAVMGYNYFVTRLNYFGGELEGFASEFIGTLAKERLL
ncbi:MAG: MotA/TolQ/ExbB proton channel family protein [Gemmatimonadetes bacterium]|nr:MotA/TolQ/ExbB proton channel family protein [Gemmatimonadota bacterium]